MLKKGAMRTDADSKRRMSISARITLSYSLFLLLCLVLGALLYATFTTNARDTFWKERSAGLKNSISTMDDYLTTADNFSRQLLNNSRFIRFSNMNSMDEYGYMSTAFNVKNDLAERNFAFYNTPVDNLYLWLKNSDFIISGGQFTQTEQYYYSYRRFSGEDYQLWRSLLVNATSDFAMDDMALFSNVPNKMQLVRDLTNVLPMKVPAVLVLEWDTIKVQSLFLTQEIGEQAVLLCENSVGRQQLLFAGKEADSSISMHFSQLRYDSNNNASFNKLHIIRQPSDVNDWVYYLAMPQNLVNQALGNYDLLFILIMVLAVTGGAAVVLLLVRRNMQPIEALGTELKQAKGRQAELQEEVDAQRPAVCLSYMRKLLSGHISFEDEFAYMLDYMHIAGDNMRYFVLSCMSYNHDESLTHSQMNEVINATFPAFLETDYPVYFYSSVLSSYYVLISYDETISDPLIDLQTRVHRLHEHLLLEHAIWLYAGVGKMCTQPLSLWESYEQARTAARYTAKHHIFLPYEMIKKDTESVYYPIELSAKLLHFITSGNSPQVVELLALVYQENINERTLPINQLNFLLSDLRNTLLKARFSISDADKAPKEKLDQIDTWLSEQATFPQCERIALEIATLFKSNQASDTIIPEVEKFLQDNYSDPSMCLSKLSEVFHISESYLSHLFKEKTGQNFSVYLENLRLLEAQRRLQQDKNCSLQTLYLDLGYNNATSFRRAFKKRFAVTPSAMRESSFNKNPHS